MRFACGDMRDHIVSYQNDPRPSYWRRRALRQQARLKIYFSEILPVVRFSTFATISAQSRRGGAISVFEGNNAIRGKKRRRPGERLEERRRRMEKRRANARSV